MIATGKWLGRIVLAITVILTSGTLCGPYQAKITLHVNQQLTMALTARQSIPARANQEEKKTDCNIPNIQINFYIPSDHRNIVT